MGFCIPEHGENPWRSRRCNRGLGVAGMRATVSSVQAHRNGKAAILGVIRKPEDLLNPLEASETLW
jgi:hypothetical protein